jgi:4-alpha-glucanotransferase
VMQPRAEASRAAPIVAAAVAGRGAPVLGGALDPAYSSLANMPDWHKGRRVGVVLHPTSLPGHYGIGTLGEQALRFVDWLADAGMQCWQARKPAACSQIPLCNSAAALVYL